MVKSKKVQNIVKMPRTSSPAPYECTVSNCKSKIKSSLEANIHPLVGSLICRKCYKSYGDGDFASLEGGVDELGDDNYCRWCVDGGDLFGCSNEKAKNDERCHYSFCRDCIAANVHDDPILKDGGNNPWYCYACQPEKIKHLRDAAHAAIQDLKDREARQKQQSNKKDPIKEKPKEQPPVIEINRKEPREKSKLQLTTPIKTQQSNGHRQRPNILSKSVITPKSNNKDQQQTSDSAKKDTSREKLKEQSQQDNNKVSKEKSNDSILQASNKEKLSQQTQSDTSKKELSKTKDTPQQEKAKEPTPLIPTKQNQTTTTSSSSSSIQPQTSVLPPKEFVKDIKSLNQPKKRKFHESKLDTPSKSVTKQMFQDCFADTLNKRETKSVPVTREDLIKRFEDYRKIGHNCVREIEIKFGKIIEMLMSEKELNETKKRKLVNDEIDSLSTPINEFNSFIRDLKRLNNASS